MAENTAGQNHEQQYSNDPLYMLMNNAGNAVPYRPVLRELTGDVKAAILLQQVIFNFVRKGRKPFYKFQAPSQDGHPLYRDGDSWVEELGFSADELKQALKKIAVFVRRDEADRVLRDTTPVFGTSPDKRCKSRRVLLNAQHLVVYWKVADNTRRFCLNERLLINAISQVQTMPAEDIPLQNMEKSHPGNGKSPTMLAKLPSSYNIEDCIDNCTDDDREEVSTVLPASTCGQHDGEKSRFLNSYRGNSEIDGAIMSAWRTSSPALVAQLRMTLLGSHPPASKHYECNVSPSATSDEISEMSHYYQHVCPGIPMPTDPAKVQHWLYQTRSLIPGHVMYKGHKIVLSVKVPPERDEPTKARNYVRQYYPEEHARLQALYKEIDENIGPRDDMTTVHWDCYGHRIEANVLVPRYIFAQGDDALWKYLHDQAHDEWTRLQSEFKRVIEQRELDLGNLLAS